jgi:hypothetical protein
MNILYFISNWLQRLVLFVVVLTGELLRKYKWGLVAMTTNKSQTKNEIKCCCHCRAVCECGEWDMVT